MSNSKKYITRIDFHDSKQFKKIDRHINVCLKLIQRLVSFNKECQEHVISRLKIENYIIDFRVEQFQFYHETLAGIYYGCYSLKYVYDISTMMSFAKVETTIGKALNTKQSHITFTGIVQMSSMFEFTRKEYEKNIKGTKYFEQLKSKYPNLGNSLELLNNFRNTIHSNGRWGKEQPLEYMMRGGSVTINKGDYFLYDYWKLYRLLKDCIELSTLMALDNKAAFIRETRLKNGDGKVVVFNTGLDINKLLQLLNNRD